MKRGFRKFAGVLLAAIMVFSMLPVATIAHAEDADIDSVELRGYYGIECGEWIIDYDYYIYTDDLRCDVDNAVLMYYDEEVDIYHEYKDDYAKCGYRYFLVVTLESESGYSLENATATLEGIESSKEEYDSEYDEKTFYFDLGEATPITSLSVTHVYPPCIGENAIVEEMGCDNDSVYPDETKSVWQKKTGNDKWEDMDGEEKFNADDEYRLKIIFSGTEDVIIDEDVEIFVNYYAGTPITDDETGEVIGVYYEFGKACDKPSQQTLIGTIEVEDVTVPVDGEKPDTMRIGTHAVEYTIKNEHWYNDDEDESEITGNFVADEWYVLKLEIELNEGYYFDDGYSMLIDADGDPDYDYDIEGNVMTLWLYYRCLKNKPILDVKIDGIVTPVNGEHPDYSNIAPPEDAKYSIVDGGWLDVDVGSMVGEGLFIGGRTYVLYLMLECEEDYAFGSARQINAYFGDTKAQVGYVRYDYMSLYCVYVAEEGESVTDINILGVTCPVIGEKPTTEGLAVGDETKLEIVSATWEIEDSELDATHEFVKDVTYTLDIIVQAKKGYTLDIDEVENVRVNAKNCESLYEYMVYDDPELCGENQLMVRLVFEAVSDEVITTVEIEGVKLPVVGAFATTDGIKAVEGMGYTVQDAMWVDASMMMFRIGPVLKSSYYAPVFRPFTGRFEQGKVYALMIALEADEEHIFNYGRMYLKINGEYVPYINIGMGRGFALIENDRTSFIKTYVPAEAEYIKEVKVDGVIEAKPGEKPSYESVKIPDDANYTIRTGDMRYEYLDENNEWQPVPEGEEFKKDTQYSFYVELEVKEGYMFDQGEEFKATINDRMAEEKFFIDNGAIVGLRIPMTHEHHVEKVPAKDPTVDEPGNKEYYKCTGCDDLFWDEACTKPIENPDDVVIPALKDSAMYGDVNCDGVVNMEDVTSLQKIIAKLTTHEAYGALSRINSDCNHDDDVNMMDVVEIQKYVAKLIDSLDPKRV
ncbi:MAG: dockerin type I repeat-containing protein [Clostridiales bacterium]|nr:dockerin type I repeat-containing protein [Clostridiales bacterium]